MTRKRIAAAVLGLLAAVGLFVVVTDADAAVAKVPMFDQLAVQKGLAKVDLVKGTVVLKATLAQLPVLVNPGTPEEFTATIYRAYLASSTDAAIEIPLGSVYPTGLGVGTLKAALRGNVSLLGLDRVVVVAYSKDGLSSSDVLTGTILIP